MYSNMECLLAEVWGDEELEGITECQAAVESLLYAVSATQQDNS